jgi:hypothetical protein
VPTHTSYVGPTLLPLATAGANSAIRPALEVGILDFAGFLAKTAADAKLAEMGGPVTSAAITDACPAAHRFPWDHSGTFMRPLPAEVALAASEGRQPLPPLPAMYCWVTQTVPTAMGATPTRSCLEHTVRLDYIFPQLQIPGGFDARSGLVRAIGDQLARYFGPTYCTRHPSYGYGSDADGTPLYRSLRCFDIVATRVSYRPKAVAPTGSSQGNVGRPGNEGHVQRFFPCFELELRAIVPVEPPQPVEPDDVLGDTLVTMNVG